MSFAALLLPFHLAPELWGFCLVYFVLVASPQPRSVFKAESLGIPLALQVKPCGS